MESWTVQTLDEDPRAAAAAAALGRGLALLGASIAAAPSSGDGPVAILNFGSGAEHAWSWRRSPDRIEIFSDSIDALPWAVYDFLEASGLALPLENAKPRTSGPAFDKASARRIAAAPERIAVFSSDAEGDLVERAESRAFSAIATEGTELDLGDYGEPSDILERLEAEARADACPAATILCDPETAVRIVGAASSASEGRWAMAIRGLRLAIDDRCRCRGHALGDATCERNAPFRSAALREALRGWNAVGGGSAAIRLGYGDERAFGVQPPLLPSLAGADVEHAISMGFDGAELRMPSRSVDRPDANAWAFSRACFSSPRDLREFVRSSFGTASSADSEDAMISYYRDIEEAWRLVLARDSAPEGEERSLRTSPLDPRGDPGPFHRIAAERYDRVYAFLDCAKASLEKSSAEYSGRRGWEAERSAFVLASAAIEAAGALRALYAGIASDEGISRDVFLIADETERRLEAAARGAGGGKAYLDLARRTFRPPLEEARELLPKGPLGRIAAALRRAARGSEPS